MTWLILGLILWWAVHLLPVAASSMRQGLTNKIGLGPSKGLAAVLIILSVVLMVVGYQAAAPTIVWTPPDFMWHINNLLMVIAVIVFIAGSFPSVIRQRIRHPQLTGTKIWALAHLLVNGDVPSIVLFVGILAWAVVSLIFSNRRDGPRGTPPRTTMVGTVLNLGVGILVAGAVMMAHLHLGGISPFPG